MMKSLAELQNDFARAVLQGTETAIGGDIVDDGIPPDERLNIYRNNTFITLSQALEQNFPVLCRLVGKTFFDHMTREFIRKYPPASPVLLCYGTQMPEFLTHFTPLKDMPYMADVARLEVNWTMCFNGPEPDEFDLHRLSEVVPEKFPDLRFSLLPNLCLMASPFPILDIWLNNQEGAMAQEISLEDGECYLALYRKERDVEIMRLDRAGYDFLGNIKSGMTLGEGAEEVILRNPDFDLQMALHKVLQNGLIDGFTYCSITDSECENVK